MSVQVKGSGTIGGLDEGLVVSGIVTASTQINVGSNIKIGSAGVVTATSFVGSGANLTGITQTTINSNTNNYLITGTGTANTLQGEANLTFDGNDLSVTGTAPAINFIDTDSDDYKIHNVQGVLKITDTTASADRFVINDNGTGYFVNNFQIGSTTSSPGASLHVKTSYPSLKVDSGGHASDAYVRIISGNAQNSRVDFGDTDDDNIGVIDYDHANNSMSFTTNTSEKLNISSGGDVSIADGNLVVANGHGIDFSATANAQPGQYNSINPTTDSEILHDYEFGSFTPHIRTQGGTSNATYAQKGGYYTKIGRMVYCTFFMNWSNGSNHSGYIYFVGLPYFSGSNTSSHLMYGIGTVQLGGFSFGGNRNPLLHMGAQTSGTNLACNNSGGNATNEGHTSNGFIIANITYIANY